MNAPENDIYQGERCETCGSRLEIIHEAMDEDDTVTVGCPQWTEDGDGHTCYTPVPRNWLVQYGWVYGTFMVGPEVPSGWEQDELYEVLLEYLPRFGVMVEKHNGNTGFIPGEDCTEFYHDHIERYIDNILVYEEGED